MRREIRQIVNEIMRGRKELRREREDIIRNGDWEDIIPLIIVEKTTDIADYRERLEKAGITLEQLRDIASHSGARLTKIQETGAMEISFRKADHSAVAILTEDGKLNTLMKNFLDY